MHGIRRLLHEYWQILSLVEYVLQQQDRAA